MSTTTPSAAPPYVWQTCLDVEAQQAAHYLDYVNTPLFDLVQGSPRRVLELGCAGGMFGQRLKERHPGATVVGIEPGRAAAAVAATRIDRVIAARLEDVDFAAEGFSPGEFDLVVAADVLEHLANPWEALVKVRPFLAPDAHLIASIPNVRNLGLLTEALLNGRWRYADRGLLDITHLRFFTLEEIKRLFEETGYRLEGFAVNLSRELAEVYQKNRGQERVTLSMGRLTIADVKPQELAELCAEQFLVRARPA